MTLPGSAQTHVRGQTAFNRPASITLEALAFTTDLAISAVAFFLLLSVSGFSLAPRFAWIPGFFAVHFGAWVLQRVSVSTTLGERIWALRFKGGEDGFGQKIRGHLFRQDGLNRERLVAAIILTLLAWTAVGWVAQSVYRTQPQWHVAELWKIQPFMPSDLGSPDSAVRPGDAGEKWAVNAFFYSLGAWPTTFLKKPVFYSLPYEKGPPSRFLGHIQARWATPDIDLIFEGPKTPTQRSRSEIQDCLRHPLFNPRMISCLQLREAVLRRHFEEMKAVNPMEWEVRWFTVENPALPDGDQAQGMYVHAIGQTKEESRFILITPKGTHQAVILKGTRTSKGASDDLLHAQKLLESAIGSIRMSDSLDTGRAWTDRQLSAVRLNSLPDPAQSEEFLLELARIEAMLVSKLSVDPKTFDTYYHLAGAAWILIRSGASQGKADWTAAATPLLESLYKYGQDVLPPEQKRSKRMIELENLWLGAKKFSVKKSR